MSLPVGIRAKHLTCKLFIGVADGLLLNHDGEMNAGVVAGAEHAGTEIGRRPTPKYHGRSPVEIASSCHGDCHERPGMENEFNRVIDAHMRSS